MRHDLDNKHTRASYQNGKDLLAPSPLHNPSRLEIYPDGVGCRAQVVGRKDQADNNGTIGVILMTDNDKLWCIHIPGPDDLFAMPSKSVAESYAARHNAAIAEYWQELEKTKTAEQLEFYPPIESIKARVIEWPWWPKDHEEALKKFEAAEIGGDGNG